MGFQDPSYRIYLNDTEDGAIIYKILDRTAVVSGDPLCSPHLVWSLLQKFRNVCKQNRCKVVVVGASDQLARLAQQERCITMQFGTEKIINPVTNPVLTGGGGKRTIQKCRQLLKSGLTVETYDPSLQHDAEIEAKITWIYNDWRAIRNESHTCQAYVTVYDLFFLLDIMTYLVVRDKQREIIGFAALHMIFFRQPKLRTALAVLHSANVDMLLVVKSSSAQLRQRVVLKSKKMRSRSRE
jgi:lysylphosphatidylglycerol synthetase-like protein (DUF2156 family)